MRSGTQKVDPDFLTADFADWDGFKVFILTVEEPCLTGWTKNVF
jgi:hypothetical protein